MYYIIFIFGLCLGSFLNVLASRLSLGESVINPKRSYCDKCHHTLSFFDLIPVLSYVFSLGKCRYCKEKISIYHPILEILTGLLYVCSYKVFGFGYEFVVGIILSSLFICVIVSDVNYLIIPDELIVVSSILLIISSFIFNGLTTFKYILNGSIMFFIMYLIMLFGNFIFKKETLGGADIKLMFISGFSLGVYNSILNIYLSSIIALPVSLILLFKNKDSIIPFGPFIILSMLFIFFFQINIIDLINTIK